ncbi:MAG: helix-turn-helix transcriptional regulator [Rhodomicrobium sp.]
MTELTPELCRCARVTLGWTQQELADRAQVAYETIANYESQLVSPDAQTLHDITSALEEGGVEFLPPMENITRGKGPIDAPAQRDRNYWLARAYEAYALAEEINDSVAREIILSVARNYEKLAECAET